MITAISRENYPFIVSVIVLKPGLKHIKLKLFIRDLLPVNQVLLQGSIFGLAIFLLFLKDFPLHWKTGGFTRRMVYASNPYTVMNVFAKESKVL